MGELVTVLVADRDAVKEDVLDYLDPENYAIRHVCSLDDAQVLLEDDTFSVNTVIFSISPDNPDFDRDLRKLKRKEKAKYVPFIGILEDVSMADQFSRQPFFHVLEMPLDQRTLCHTVDAALADFKRYKALLSDVKSRTSAIGLIKSGKFRLQTLQQAEALTTMLSLACPEPGIIALGLSEILVNAIEHGNLGISYQLKSTLLEKGTWNEEIDKRLASDDYKDRFVEIRFDRTETRIDIIVTDQGDGFDWRKYVEKDPSNHSEKHGRGIAIAINMGFDSVIYNEKGNQVTASVNL
ncbi:ATP-binding protein [Terasakiella sp. A23]|uniref:ATP-binding protein n=1 Tax=Terasakiella sp. FCG-A23 TaxID=3080561 RepID=UPI0029545E04|nr:ATP-binding protein [Terasakiella sp. A23]MDV7338699.1 ATP-binding protein [Terasakiella sp. A23]